MGCIFTKVCLDEGELADEGEKTRRASHPNKKTLLLVETGGIGGTKKVTRSDDDTHDYVYIGGGVPGVALDAERVELPEYTGARDGGFQSLSKKLRWGTRSRAGNDPLRRRKENQDSFCVCDGLAEDKNVTLFCVFDGHGPEGAYVSHFVRDEYYQTVALAYAEHINRASTTSASRATVSCDIISETFNRAAQLMTDKLTATSIDISVSGTTAVAMLVCDRDLFIANIGDSRAIVAQFDEQESKYALHFETQDHKPDVPEERQRIEANNGRVFEWGSYRVWLQDVDMPGLAMSRSFGDSVAKTVGVTSDPDVTLVERITFGNAERPSFAVLASDGVWEFMTSDECIDFISDCIVNSKMDPQSACDALVEEALDRWNAEEDVVDDITVAVVYF
ncbi:TPA: hypothetical protein N0F65_010406 [Lagenidium giganteum]|uniref:PPM-type phosphatase domain-containing protein n=1 Tax=Lagenidium giganteum TaxID=4803 RepID=A0AAV2YXG1_9STRA|nr:TPA: hypothetical protein N0F65_010406 [Lagenidium giganteum]